MLKKQKTILCILLSVLVSMSLVFFAAAETEALKPMKLGDVNNDGVIMSDDARLVLRHVAKLEVLDEMQQKRADINWDEEISAADARIILRIVAKLEKEPIVELNISFDLNYDKATQNANQKVLWGQFTTEPKEPARNGYTFEGWYKEAAYTNKFDFNKEIITSDTTLHAKWKEIENVVSFNLNYSGAAKSATQKVIWGKFAVEPKAPARNGYTFEGWYKEAANTNKFDFNKETITSDITLYAKWKEIENVVSFNLNYSGAAKPTTQKVIQGKFAAEPKAPVRNGYIFEGWYKEAANNNKFDFKKDKITSDITLYAKWKKAEYSVGFNLNYDGSSPYGTQKVLFELFASEPKIPEREGFLFEGWYKEASNKNKFDFKKDKITSDITLYAKWKELPIVLSSDKNEFIVSNQTETVYFYAQTSQNAEKILLLDEKNNVLADMKDDGLYPTSGDDIENDGIYTCKLNIDISKEQASKYRAVFEKTDEIASNEIVIYIIAELTDKELADIQDVDTQIADMQKSSGYKNGGLNDRKEKMEKLLSSLEEKGLIKKSTTFFNNDSGVFTFAYKNGILGAVIIKDFNNQYDGTETAIDNLPVDTLPSAISAAPTSDNLSGGIGKAIMLNAFENNSFRRDYYPKVKTDWDKKGLETTVVTDVTVSRIKNLKEYEIIWFAGHGGAEWEFKYGGFLGIGQKSIIDTVWLLNENYSNETDKLYAADLKQHRIIHVNANLGKAYAMFPSLISDTYSAGDFNDSFIIFNSCEIMGKNGNVSNSMANAFLNCSAKSFIGYHNSVASDYSREYMKIYVDNLIDGETAKKSFDNAVAKRGANDGGSPAAYPLLRGDNNATLVNNGIKNGSFEDALTPVKWKTFADVRVITKLGELSPTNNKRMAMLSTGIGGAKDDYISGFSGATQGSIMQQTVKLSNSVKALSFDYNMVSEEPPEYVGTPYNDTFIVEILDSKGNVLKEVVYESVNTSTWLPVSGFKLTVGQTSGRPAWQTGWKTASFDLTPYKGQIITLRFLVFDRGDSAFDSAALIDNVVIK